MIPEEEHEEPNPFCRPKHGNADNMPSFREAFPTPEYLDDDGVKNLVAAIVLRVAQDYYDVCDRPENEPNYAKAEIERSLRSGWFETISSIDINHFVKIIREHKKAGKPMAIYIPKGCDVVPPNKGSHRSSVSILSGNRGARWAKASPIF